MSDIYIYLDMDPYLAQWFIHDHGGAVPVVLRKGSPDSNLLVLLLRCLPANAKPDLPRKGAVPVMLPYNQIKNVRYNFYLGHKERVRLVKHIRNRFLVELWDDLHRWNYIGKEKQWLIYEWMKAHGIKDTETNYFAVQKNYQRLRNTAFMREWRKKYRKR